MDLDLFWYINCLMPKQYLNDSIVTPSRLTMNVLVAFLSVCLTLSVSHQHGSSHHPNDEHYVNGEHNTDYDKKMFLGGEEEAEEFAELSPEEQLKRLRSIIKKIDTDADGYLTEDELSLWIQKAFKHYVLEDTKEQFAEIDQDGDGVVTWGEYNMHMYDRIIDYSEDTVLEDDEEESFRLYNCEVTSSDFSCSKDATEDPQWVIVEKDRFVNDYDKDGDGKLNPTELLSWIVPNNVGASQEEANHLIDSIDKDGDGRLSEAEILQSQDIFLTSEATDYGRQLQDEHFYHDEL
ncbi:reticulocalbin-2 [Hyperolius riggenbachi]|uniref:reticulocalbin-2 n=1 Tax=Hyperolius riggenbachi TaxID=752182 RepID=UPI0035A328A9